MDLVERLESYEVTEVPPRRHLRLVWTAPAEADETEADVVTGRVLPLLASYRITFVPAGAAS